MENRLKYVPNIGERFLFIDITFDIVETKHIQGSLSCVLIEYGNCFRTKNDAQKVVDTIHNISNDVKVVEKAVNDDSKNHFSIEDLKPFQNVIVRSKELGKSAVWQTAIFSHVERDTYDGKLRLRYVASNDKWNFCVPYNEETSYLIGTNLTYDGFYRTW